MRQIVYVSTVTSQADSAAPSAILAASIRNNARDGITGLLYSDGKRFLQALEGEEDLVEHTLARIAGDPRHRAIVILSDRTVATREFGDWSMARRQSPGEAEQFLAQVTAKVANASPCIRATFEGFAEARRAA